VLWQHRIAVTDFGLINGQKVLSFDNSWGEAVSINGLSYPIGNNGQQFLTEAYAPFMYGGIYTLDPSNITSSTPATPPPKHTFTTMFGVGTSGPEVLALQQCLQSLGFFPVNSVIKPTGYFGGISKEGVEMFQAAFGIPVTGTVDTQTILELNKVFA
jgi:peptidoglycan hydrolase-like protein with peptidoglycan-binding domain